MAGKFNTFKGMHSDKIQYAEGMNKEYEQLRRDFEGTVVKVAKMECISLVIQTLIGAGKNPTLIKGDSGGFDCQYMGDSGSLEKCSDYCSE